MPTTSEHNSKSCVLGKISIVRESAKVKVPQKKNERWGTFLKLQKVQKSPKLRVFRGAFTPSESPPKFQLWGKSKPEKARFFGLLIFPLSEVGKNKTAKKPDFSGFLGFFPTSEKPVLGKIKIGENNQLWGI